MYQKYIKIISNTLIHFIILKPLDTTLSYLNISDEPIHIFPVPIWFQYMTVKTDTDSDIIRLLTLLLA